MADPRIAVVGIPGKWSTERLAEAIEARTGLRLVVDMGEVSLDLAGGKLLYRGEDLSRLDALIVKKISATYDANTLDRLELLRAAEDWGLRIFSPVRSMLGLIDRLSCTLKLAAAGVPIPPTRVTEHLPEAMAAIEEFGSAILKPLYSTKAKGMTLIESDESSSVIEAKLKQFQASHPMLYIQQRLDLGNRDLGMVFLAGQYLGTYARVGQAESWNTTIASGGRYEAYSAASDLIELAERAQEPFGLDFTTVDVAVTPDGPVVFEVSAFGGFRGGVEGIGIDPAGLYADHVLRELRSEKES